MRNRTRAALGVLGGVAVLAACGFDGVPDAASGVGDDGGVREGATLPESAASDALESDGAVEGGDGGDASGCSGDLATDALHCGRCGHSCLGGACAAGKCTPATLATVTHPYELTVGPTDVYWTDKGDAVTLANVARCVKAGGPVILVAASAAGFDPASVVLADDRVVFTDTARGNVYSCPLPGPGCTTGDQQNSEAHPMGIAWNGASVFWANRDSGNLRRGDKTITTTSFFAQSEFGLERVAATPTAAYWTVPGGIHGKGIAVGGSVSISTTSAPRDVAMDATHVYFALATEVRRMTYAATGNAVVATGVDIQRIAVDASGVYFTERGAGTGRVLRCPLAGCVGAPEVLATGEGLPLGIALDATHVYWANEATTAGTIRRVAK